MGTDEGAEGCSNSVVVVVDNNNDTNNNDMLTTHDHLSSASQPQAPAGDNSDNIYAGQAAASSGKDEGEDTSESKHKANSLPCRICLGVDLEGCAPASLMPHAAIQSLQEEGLDLRHFMACGPHCAKRADECATSPTQLRCGCRGGMAVAHYVCALGWLAKRKTHKCEICGQIVASIRAADITLFASASKSGSNHNIAPNTSHHNQLPPVAEEAIHLDVINNNHAQPHPAAYSLRSHSD
eukprot:jgi/Chlat1/1793/Chrsp134S02118